MTISLTGSAVHGSQPQSLFPIYVLLVKPLSDIADTQVIICLIVALFVAVRIFLLIQISA